MSRLRYEYLLGLYNAYIPLSVDIASEPCLPHGPSGIFISGKAKIGKDVVIFQQVTIGSNALGGRLDNNAPIIGDNVYIGAGAKIIGGVTIGDHCRIGANCCVYSDMPPHSVAVSSPTRIIQKTNLDNRHFDNGLKDVYFWENGAWHFFCHTGQR